MEAWTRDGRHATETMQALAPDGSPVTCILTGERTRGREVGYCFRGDGLNLNQAIIISGAALACPRYDARYVALETEEARARLRRAKYCAP